MQVYQGKLPSFPIRAGGRKIGVAALATAMGALGLSASISTEAAAQTSERRSKPNVIIIYTDDHGYRDLGVQGYDRQVITPNIDALARGGARMTDGYSTGPQCVPSRGGLIAGVHQNRFGLESNPDIRRPKIKENFDNLTTVPERMQMAGYQTGMSGKWHLGDDFEIGKHGFDVFFEKSSNSRSIWNMNFQGRTRKDKKAVSLKVPGYHIDASAKFMNVFIDRFKDKPFFFYWAPRAPHVPLDPPKAYVNRVKGEMPRRRRLALAMMIAVDDAVGRLMAKLREHDLEEDTLIFIMSDNGAPLKIFAHDESGGGGGWDGSLNAPLNGEKGMLAEGGIRVPYLAYWKGTIPAGTVYSEIVSTLDAGATAVTLANRKLVENLDGKNLIPYLTGKRTGAPHASLAWRWLEQSAIRRGSYKFIRHRDDRYLYNIKNDIGETRNLINARPEIAARLERELAQWAGEMTPAGINAVRGGAGIREDSNNYFRHYMDGIRYPDPGLDENGKSNPIIRPRG